MKTLILKKTAKCPDVLRAGIAPFLTSSTFKVNQSLTQQQILFGFMSKQIKSTGEADGRFNIFGIR
jgi:hypothetical protein